MKKPSYFPLIFSYLKDISIDVNTNYSDTTITFNYCPQPCCIRMASLGAVHITQEAFWVCMSHALTTEREEVMGLLLGDIEQV